MNRVQDIKVLNENKMDENCDVAANNDAEHVAANANLNGNDAKTEKSPTNANDDDSESERWTYPLSGSAASLVASDGKQLSYVHRMAQKFDELAEGRNANWCSKSGAFRRAYTRGNADDGDDADDDTANGVERMLRSKSLIELMENRHRLNENNNDSDGEFSEAFTRVVIGDNYDSSANETVIDEIVFAADNDINDDKNDDDGVVCVVPR